jgi:hypothetical protein
VSRPLFFLAGMQVPHALWEHPGKPEWPDQLRVELTHRDALGIIERLAAALVSGDRLVSFELFGELSDEESKL